MGIIVVSFCANWSPLKKMWADIPQMLKSVCSRLQNDIHIAVLGGFALCLKEHGRIACMRMHCATMIKITMEFAT